ncbi:MAG TPA: hypothetical protein VNA30_06160 [Mycobacteriales bacterium]|nr:hypothetical protein [Mycobacteriales bacterium]
MPDIHQLLASAAREDIDPLDLGWVEKRAGVLRLRQRVARSAVAAGVALTAVVFYRGPGAGSQAVEQVPADRRPPASASATPLTAMHARSSAAPPLAFAAPERPVGGAPSIRPSARPVQTEAKEPSPSPTGREQSGAFPPASSCRVSTTALAPEQTATCRFTATESGGYEIFGGAFVLPDDSPVAFVEVVRDGRTARYDVWSSPSPCRSNIIEIGDQVTVTAGQGKAGSYFDYELAAGVGYSCEGR